MSSDTLGTRNGGVDWTPVPQTALVIHPAKAGDGRLRTPQMRLEEAKQAREAFITGAGSLVTPVVSIDGVKVGDGKPGPVATKLRASYVSEARSRAL